MLDLPIVSADEIDDEAVSWPIVEHRVLGEGRIQTFVSDTVRTPDGGEMVRDYLRHTGAVGVIALDEQERVVVVRQVRHPVGFRLVEPPAGLLDEDGEDVLVAAKRELAEEAMVEASDWRVLVDYMTSPGCLQETLRVYLARGLTSSERPEGFVVENEEADMDVVLVSLEDLVNAIYAGRVQNPTMVVGALSAYTALRTGRVEQLRSADSPWPARDVKRRRDDELDAFEHGVS
ncbi:NUDIX domain-containing protein [Nigerium massiliense]|uniref:NUDIX domain-containing protein n=1 Tax=Nigerium massiliense TaxID=1522317 RepID=UPI00058DB64D|nr:NUDIX hydrolase [Nigerium massiliense]